jgi:phosphatidylinositol alpha-mannosyltransferase
VSPDAATTVQKYLPGDYEVIPNGVAMPEIAELGNREARIVFIGRHEPRKGLQVLLRAWPEIRRQTGARLRVLGADPLQVRLLLTRHRIPDEGIDALGFVSEHERTDELLKAKAFVAPSLGGESFGMVLTEAFACATPVVASDIPGYRDVMTAETGVVVPPDDPRALAQAVASLLADEPRRLALGTGARRRAQTYSWDDIGRRLLSIYELVTGTSPATVAAAG